MPSSISTNGMRVQTGKSIADHVTFGARPVRISHALAPRPRGVGADPHTGTRGGELENHTGPFTASMTGERGRPRADQTSRLSASSVSRGPQARGRGSAVGTLEAFARGAPLTGPWRENPAMTCDGAAAVRWAARPARPCPVVPPDPRRCSAYAGPMVTTLPYGSWPSPLTAELLATGGTQLGSPRLVGDAVWWTEGIATEGGRQAIVRTAGPVPRAPAGGSDRKS